MSDQELDRVAISDEPILSLQQAINGAQRRAAEAGEPEEPEELEQWLLIAGWLRELRARRITMGDRRELARAELAEVEAAETAVSKAKGDLFQAAADRLKRGEHAVAVAAADARLQQLEITAVATRQAILQRAGSCP